MDKWEISKIGTFVVRYLKCLSCFYHQENQKLKGAILTITEPPEPNDIFWENLGTPYSTIFKTRMVTAILSVFLLFVSFGAILLIKYGQVVYLKTANKAVIRGLISFAISFLIAFINGMLGFAIRKISLKEKHETKTNYNISVTKRIAIVKIKFVCCLFNLFLGSIFEYFYHYRVYQLDYPQKRS